MQHLSCAGGGVAPVHRMHIGVVREDVSVLSVVVVRGKWEASIGGGRS
jgi:hypothetical protein